MNTTTTQFTLKDFVDLDHSNNIDFLISSMEAHYTLESMKEIKQRALEILCLEPGDKVLELGCGLGHDAEALAIIVKDTGSVTAIDASKRMIEEAQKRSKHDNVAYAHGDANDLNFPDGCFSACRADRLLVSQENIDQVLTEALRVIKPSGKLCITDLDFGTMTLSPYIENSTDLIIRHWQKLVMNPFLGRTLLALFKRHGLVNIKIQPEVFIVTSYETLTKIVQFETMLEDMVMLKQINQDQKFSIINALKEADKKGEFFWSINLFTVVGTVNSFV